MMKKLLCLTLAACMIFVLAACGGSGQESNSTEDSSAQEATEAESKSDETGTAGSNIALKDNPEEAAYQIEVAMQKLLEQAYGDKVNDARIYVEKVYSTEDEQANEILASENLGPDEVAFEVRYELHPADGVDVNELLVANGDYDEESGWVIDKYSVGILRPSEDGSYTITDFGTGW